MNEPSLVFVEAVIDKFMFVDASSGFAIAKAIMKEDGETITLKGNIANVGKGEKRTFHGTVGQDNYGEHILVSYSVESLPDEAEEAARYLETLPGIGPVRSKTIVMCLGANAVKMLMENPGLIHQVSGLSSQQRTDINEILKKHTDNITVRTFLAALRLPERINHQLENISDEILKSIQLNPYELVEREMIKFSELEKKLNELGRLNPSLEGRLRAAVVEAFAKMDDLGHTWGDIEHIIWQVQEITGSVMMSTQLAGVIEKLEKAKRILKVESGWALTKIGRDEEAFLKFMDLPIPEMDLPDFTKLLQGLSFEPTQEQIDCVKTILFSNVSVLTGGAGVGKTSTLKLLIRALGHDPTAAWIEKKSEILMLSPTGKAAKRMTEQTGLPAMTIHKMALSFDPIVNDPDKPITLIIDESSMINVEMVGMIARVIADLKIERIVFVGDDAQLPAIGAGRILGDIIASDTVPICRLNKIMRQAAQSRIIKWSSLVRDGKTPDFSNQGGDAWFTQPESHVDPAAVIIAALEAGKLDEMAGRKINPIMDIQVISPLANEKFKAGAYQLNQRLQSALNPQTSETKFLNVRGTTFRTGDKVVITKNLYNIESSTDTPINLMNGEMAIITSINQRAIGITPLLGSDEIILNVEESEHLKLGYALSAHKTQGSEFPFVIFVIPEDTPRTLLVRNLVYTAMTRAQKTLWILGSETAIKEAISREPHKDRRTRLDSLLKAWNG